MKALICRVARGGLFGCGVAAIWTALSGPWTDEIHLTLCVYAIALALTGMMIGVVGRFPALLGLAAVPILAGLAVIVGPKDGWLVLWMAIFGGTGLILGPLTGLLIWLFGGDLELEQQKSLD